MTELCKRAGWDLRHEMILKSQSISVTLQEGYESRYLFSVEKPNSTSGSAIKNGEAMKVEGASLNNKTTSDEGGSLMTETSARERAKAERIAHLDRIFKLDSGTGNKKPLKDTKTDFHIV